MNILVTNVCNRRCSYCFAAERISYSSEEADGGRQAPRFISMDDFRTASSFAARSRQPVVGILGGEPSLHPEFVPLLEAAWSEGLDTKIFTNGLWDEDRIDALEAASPGREKRIHIVLNMNEPRHTPPWQAERQDRFLSRLGRFAALSFNIFELDFDPLFLVNVIRRHSTRRDIRLGVAQPLASMSNEHIAVADYRGMAPTLIRLARACDESDVALGFDCGFTMCMFTAEELGVLQLAGSRFGATCGPAMDVGTDLSVWACFPLSTLSKGVRLADFENMDALGRHFNERLHRLYRAGVLAECIDCRHRRRHRCSGGCAAHVYRSLNP